MTAVFISYAREDRAFVQRLHDALARDGHEAWVDWEGIPASAEWMAEVRAAIDESECFCFVVSPDSVGSPVCREEAVHAAASNKRIVPLLRRDVSDGAVPEPIAAHNWIEFRDEDDLDRAFSTLVKALETEPEHLRTHTRLLVRAKEWEASGRDNSGLLRGQDLRAAEAWFASAAGKDPAPAPLHTAYVLASRRTASRRQRMTTAGIALALVLSLALTAVAVTQRNAAERNEQVATDRARESRSRELAVVAGDALATDPELALMIALEAVRASDTPEAVASLQRAIVATRVRGRFSPGIPIRDAVPDPTGRWVAVSTEDGAVHVYDTTDATQVLRTEASPSVTSFLPPPTFTSDGGALAVADRDGTVRLEQLPGGTGDTASDLAWHGETQMSPDGRYVAVGRVDRITLRDATDGERLATVRGLEFGAPSFSPDGRLLIATDFLSPNGSFDPSVRVWRVPDGREVADIFGLRYAFSADGSVLAVSKPEDVVVYSTADFRPVARLGGPRLDIFVMAMSPDGSTVAASASGHRSDVWLWHVDRAQPPDVERTGSRIAGIEAVDVAALRFSPDGRLLAGAFSDGSIRVWDATSGALAHEIRGHAGTIESIDFASADALISVGVDETVRLWDVAAPSAATTFAGISAGPAEAVALADGGLAVGRTANGNAALFDVDDESVGTKLGPRDVTTAVVGDGTVAAVTGHDDGRLIAWRSDGTRGAEAALPSRIVDLDVTEATDRILAIAADGTFAVWDPVMGRTRIRSSGVRVPRASCCLFRSQAGAALSADGRFVAADAGPCQLSVWRTSDGDPVRTIDVGKGRSCDWSWSEAGAWLVAEVRGRHGLWDPASGNPVPHIDELLRRWNAPLGFAPGSPLVLLESGTSPTPSGLALFDVRRGRVVRHLVSPGAPITEAVFAPDGRSVVGFSEEDGTIRAWDIATGAVVGVLAGGGPTPDLVGFSDDGRYFATVSGVQQIDIWRTGAWQHVRSLALDDETSAWRVVEWAEGRSLLVTERDRASLYVCDICAPVSELVSMAEDRVTREITDEERLIYLGESP